MPIVLMYCNSAKCYQPKDETKTAQKGFEREDYKFKMGNIL